MLGTIGHGYAVLHAAYLVSGDGVIQRNPWLGRILFTARNQERSRRHQRMQFMKIISVRNESGIQSVRGIVFRYQPALAPRPWMVAKIPGFPIVDVLPRWLKDNSRIGPHSTGELLVKTRRKHRPLPSERVTHDPDPR